MKISDYTKSKRRGRPRSKESHKAILVATIDILVDSGVHGMSIEGVAEKAGVGKATIYRHWNSKEDLIAEAFGSIADEVVIPDSGNALNDFTAVLNGMVEVTNEATKSSDSFKRLLTGLVDSPALMEVYKEQFILPRREALRKIIEKGIERGEIHQDTNGDILIDIVVGSYFYNVLMNDAQASIQSWLEKIKPIILGGIGPKEES